MYVIKLLWYKQGPSSEPIFYYLDSNESLFLIALIKIFEKISIQNRKNLNQDANICLIIQWKSLRHWVEFYSMQTGLVYIFGFVAFFIFFVSSSSFFVFFFFPLIINEMIFINQALLINCSMISTASCVRSKQKRCIYIFIYKYMYHKYILYNILYHKYIFKYSKWKKKSLFNYSFACKV